LLDYQFLAMVAVVLAVLTRGSLLPVVAVTAFVAVVLLACEAAGRWFRDRRRGPVDGGRPPEPLVPDPDLNQWLAAVERVLTSKD
jgi:hypothetical protein